MATFSFDTISEYNKAEMNNVLAMTEKEISNRYDFKGTPAEIDWMEDKGGFKIIGANEWQIDSIIDIVRKKLASREQSSKVIDLSKEVVISNLKATKQVPFIAGLDQDKAKQITKLLREQLPNVKAQIQGETVRVVSSSKDELQTAMQLIKNADFEFPIGFNNYR
ncbi:YajQ family cyclic di-GMP-binding protein [Candidatus Saccharibacteria bacterium CG11_big_fil_rev_8_21_14_0_20_41_19]|nr:YajQ family cyclic di-GMP-binding protein [Candidatus Saccharibacteria bacterium]OIP86272.1 MAG: nucleotide-binding protein [Candidatus Saccharibacteria bacterium CG2_30_41_52]PIQ71086.1 MAG: YajQ family cyclic di-GMP-binding protein [Candidatus Saccharibacteria bacterium CG11_big_fil_rev_8_21_14_0_20_41_19]PIZ59380.1 MAG: YajQ family cyclic di-GMP-binding protein [Candidatus Saccharibacteria bacterium CG_4_10_14_0_2_um_filter_41_11]PJC29505.1 MAG: YajQ family cyclic di-GMP-binding protein [